MSSVAPARAVANTVIRRVFERGAFADRALAAEARELDARDRALATRLAYGTVQRRGTLDHVIEKLASRPIKKLDPAVLASLRLGLYQLLFLDGIPARAAVNESVELVGGPSGKFVNAVLRRASAQGRELLKTLSDATPEQAAVMHSVPVWLAQMWWRELGAEDARALLERVNEPAESALRVNTLVASATDVQARLPMKAHPAPGLDEALVFEGQFDAERSELWRAGAIFPQSRGSMLVSRTLDPQPGERVLDLCAAPGAKTTHIAQLLRDEGEVVAVERHPRRAQALEQTSALMHASCVRVVVGDAAEPYGETFDRVLVDPPCSGLGTLQSRPDVRWRATPQSIAELAVLQRTILQAGAAATAPGGTLVYSVCTISRAESEELIDQFLADSGQFVLDSHEQLLPHRDLTDGFSIAKLRRSPH